MRLHLRLIFAIIGTGSKSSGRIPMATLTKRQKQLLDYLTDYNSEHGYAPTLAEVGQYFGLSSLATVHKHLHNLEQKGFIKRQHNHSRALEVDGRRGNVKRRGRSGCWAPSRRARRLRRSRTTRPSACPTTSSGATIRSACG